MSAPHTLSALLQQAQCHFRIYDLSRRVTALSHSQFAAIEANQQPYPYPMNQQAQIAVAFWREAQAPYIWFVALPLDERGLLKQAAMGDFIKYILQALSQDPTQSQTNQQENPYSITPKEDKMAVFHAKLTAEMSLPASQYYAPAQNYFAGDEYQQGWQSLGLQGIADFCARLEQHNQRTQIRRALQHLPLPVRYATLGCLEHMHIDDKLAQTLFELLTREYEKGMGQYQDENDAVGCDLFLLTAYVRALALAPENWRDQAVELLLNDPHLNHPELLVAIAGRCWESLQIPERLVLFLLRLAELKQASLFARLFADLVRLPSVRPTALQLLNQPLPATLEQALTQMQQGLQAQ
ncbi:hypothetical protein VST7929_02157 [Vibrio stylophorae]|uniref:DUF3549 family protein n=1 Tax=Vibrio stylophorae TaxID=659351 RepID=A0ABM8ZVA5_9VIBR|nr:DUF3549 family protein [Vibrio stylophorae]CAH0534243.1 hypothetical protein VST7929_02157 [Vibrio stylophorae]